MKHEITWKQLQNEKRSAHRKQILTKIGLFLIVLVAEIGIMAWANTPIIK